MDPIVLHLCLQGGDGKRNHEIVVEKWPVAVKEKKNLNIKYTLNALTWAKIKRKIDVWFLST